MTKDEFIKKWSNGNDVFQKDLEEVLKNSQNILPDSFLSISEIYDAWTEPKSDYDLGVRSGIEITWDALTKYLKLK